MNPTDTSRNTDPDPQREALLESQRRANAGQPRNFKDDALTDKVVHIEPDGTGPSSTGTLDPQADQDRGSGDPAR